MKEPATKLPYTLDEGEMSEHPYVISTTDSKGILIVAEIPCSDEDEECTLAIAKQDAEYIIEACNNYPRLLAALRNLYNQLDFEHWPTVDLLNELE